MKRVAEVSKGMRIVLIRGIVASSMIAAAAPAVAVAAGTASGQASVLSVNARAHVIQLVDSHHVVHDYHYSGRLPAVHVGSRINFRRRGQTLSHLKASPGRSVTFYARVVRSRGGKAVLRLTDGKALHVSSKQLGPHGAKRKTPLAHAAAGVQIGAGGVTINIQGLQPGLTVLVTESSQSGGGVTITITLPAPTSPATQPQTLSGVVQRLGRDGLTVVTSDGTELRLHMAKSALAAQGLQLCQSISVVYHQDNNLLIVDSITPGPAPAAGCGNDDTNDGTSQDAVGAITAVSGSALTILTQDQGSRSFTVDDPSITDGFGVGDVVDVTYTDQGDGSLDAADVEYYEEDATGSVTTASAGALTLSPDTGAAPQVFTADPSAQLFDGVSPGDEVDVTYHQVAGAYVADAVDDLTADGQDPAAGEDGSGDQGTGTSDQGTVTSDQASGSAPALADSSATTASGDGGRR